MDWIAKAPSSLNILQDKLAILRQPLEALQKMVHGLEQATTPSGGEQAVTVQPGGGLLSDVFSGTTMTLSRSFTTIIVLYFLLSSGDRLLRGLVEVMPGFQEKRQVVEIAAEIEDNIGAYLLTISLMNVVVGSPRASPCGCAASQPAALGQRGLPAQLHPILGPLTGVGMFAAAGLLSSRGRGRPSCLPPSIC